MNAERNIRTLKIRARTLSHLSFNNSAPLLNGVTHYPPNTRHQKESSKTRDCEVDKKCRSTLTARPWWISQSTPHDCRSTLMVSRVPETCVIDSRAIYILLPIWQIGTTADSRDMEWRGRRRRRPDQRRCSWRCGGDGSCTRNPAPWYSTEDSAQLEKLLEVRQQSVVYLG